ncbi:MAG: hypothetical protein U1F58_10895 [Burkholderiales bacterium]
MAAADALPLLDEEGAAFVQGGVSIVAASRDAAFVPSIGRAVGCRVAADRRRVTVFVAGSQAPELVADLRACGRIAVVFSRPSTHRTLQLKGDDAVVRSLAGDEAAVPEGYAGAFAEDIGRIGHTVAQARTLVACVDGDLLAIDFTPNAAFEQTPGPNAGTPLPSPR